MFLQFLLLILLSVAVILLMKPFALILGYINSFQNFVIGLFQRVFAHTWLGALISKVLALVIVPLIIVVVIDSLHYIITHRHLRSAAQLMWFLWLILVICLALHH